MSKMWYLKIQIIKNSQYTKYIYILFILINFSSCFENVDATSTSGSSKSSEPVSTVSEEHFSGAKGASNKITGVEISWNSATVPVQAYRVYRVKGASLELITSVGSEVISIIDGSVTWGAVYSYVVKAVDLNGIEDANLNRVTSLSWGGLTSVTATSSTSITVTFDNTSSIADEIRVYITSTQNNSTKTLAGSISPSAGSLTINDLRPGYSYQISAQAYIDSLHKEDGNSVSYTIQTNTEGFHDNDGVPAKWRNVISVRTFGESPGAPTHPTLPDKSPKNRVVEISFNSFTGLGSTQKYVVIRTPEGMSIDTSVYETCTDTTNKSCRPCGVLTGSGVLFCRDMNVAASPARYRYTMAIQHTEGTETWIEPLPDDKIESMSVLVPIPPKDMVLVQRDAANYEMCVAQMNRSADPKNKNRCIYSGTGAKPYNSGIAKPALNLETGFYDFGYNLFVDRYSNACNWTSAAEGGKCGAGATDGDCVGIGAANANAPSNAIGVNGNIYWFLHNHGTAPLNNGYSRCLIKINNVWVQSYDLPTNTANYESYYRSMLTTDPSASGGKRPQFAGWWSSLTAMAACQSFDDPYYGKKREQRMREYRVWSAWPTIGGEPYVLSYSQANTINGGGRWNSVDGYRCGRNRTSMNTAAVSNFMPNSLNELLTSTTKDLAAYNPNSADGAGTDFGSRFFMIGAQSTIDCQSRYGVQEPFFDGVLNTSDALNFNSTTIKYTGIASPLDSGNRDLLTDLNGGQTGYLLDASSAPIVGVSPNDYRQAILNSNTTINYINLALGLPAYTSSSSHYLPRTSFTENYGSSIDYAYLSQTTSVLYGEVKSTRWGSNFMRTLNSTNGYSRLFCVLPAD